MPTSARPRTEDPPAHSASVEHPAMRLSVKPATSSPLAWPSHSWACFIACPHDSRALKAFAVGELCMLLYASRMSVASPASPAQTLLAMCCMAARSMCRARRPAAMEPDELSAIEVRMCVPIGCVGRQESESMRILMSRAAWRTWHSFPQIVSLRHP